MKVYKCIYIFRKEISRKLQWWYWFLPKITVFEKLRKNMFFAIFLSKQARNNSKFLNLLLKSDLKHSYECCVFSFSMFYRCFSFHAKYGQKFENFVIKWNFGLIGMYRQNRQKRAKMRKRNIEYGCITSTKHFRSNF